MWAGVWVSGGWCTPYMAAKPGEEGGVARLCWGCGGAGGCTWLLLHCMLSRQLQYLRGSPHVVVCECGGTPWGLSPVPGDAVHGCVGGHVDQAACAPHVQGVPAWRVHAGVDAQVGLLLTNRELRGVELDSAAAVVAYAAAAGLWGRLACLRRCVPEGIRAGCDL